MSRYSFSTLIQLVCILQIILTSEIAFAHPFSHRAILKEMFTKVTIEKNAQAIPLHYAKDFILTSNGKTMDFSTFLTLHKEIYKTPIQYTIRYAESSLIEQGNKVAARLYITTKNPNELAHEIEVMLIAEYKGNKLYRLRELTFPDWSKMPAFRNSHA